MRDTVRTVQTVGILFSFLNVWDIGTYVQCTDMYVRHNNDILDLIKNCKEIVMVKVTKGFFPNDLYTTGKFLRKPVDRV